MTRHGASLGCLVELFLLLSVQTEGGYGTRNNK